MRKGVAGKTANLFALTTVVCLTALNGLSSPTAHAQTINQDRMSLYPLTKGIKWEYADPSNRTNRMIHEITDVVMKDNCWCYEKKCTYFTQNKLPDAIEYIAVKEDGWYYIGGLNSNGEFKKNVPHTCVLKRPSSKVQSWGYGGNYFTANINNFLQHPEFTTINGEKVEAICVSQTWNNNGQNAKFDIWYIPGKGPVKLKIGTYTFDLTSISGNSSLTTTPIMPPQRPTQVVQQVSSPALNSNSNPGTKTDSWHSWDAIGAIAGVLSVIIALAAYLRKKEV